jgi:hypothetical protein
MKNKNKKMKIKLKNQKSKIINNWKLNKQKNEKWQK